MDGQEQDTQTVARLFRQLGAAPGQAEVMASQLLKRAGQIAEERGISKLEAADRLIRQVIQARQEGENGSNSRFES